MSVSCHFAQHLRADNGVEGHVGAFVVSSRVAANKDKEGAFEITHVAKLVNLESQKLSKSLSEISETFCKKSLKYLKANLLRQESWS